MTKKLFAVLLSLCLLVGLLPTAALAAEPAATDSGYSDIDGHWAEEAIKKWSAYGIFQGSNGLFDPNGELTRAQAAVIFMRLLNLTEEGDISEFTDVDPEAWYAEAIAKCVAAGILLGNTDGTMNPNGKLTREQLFTMFGRALGVESADTCDKEFADSDSVSSWAIGYINALVNMGAIDGMGDGTLAPESNINRASIVALLDKCVTYVNEEGATVTADENTIVIVAAKNVTVEGNPAIVVNTTGESTEPEPTDPTPSTPSTPSIPTIPSTPSTPHNHTYSEAWSYDKTHHWHAATCGHTDQVADKAAHSWNDGVVTTPATETEKGEKTFTCTFCGQTKTEDIDKLNHTHVWTFAAGHAANCQNEGEKDHYTCTCGDISLKEGDVYTVVADTDLVLAVDPDSHVGVLGTDYQTDDTQHWFVYSDCNHPGEKVDHDYTANQTCVCGKVNPACVVSVNGTYYTDFVEAFAKVRRVGGSTASYTINILADIDLTDKTWTSADADYCQITLNGNNHTIKGLSAPLFSSFGTNSGADSIIKDLTFENAAINENYGNTDSSGNGTAGVIAKNLNLEGDDNAKHTITIQNCKVIDSTIKAYKWAGAFIGHIGASHDGNPLVIFESCTVEDSSVMTTDTSAGGIVGHIFPATKIANCTVKNTTVSCEEDRGNGDAKAGQLVGTVNTCTTTITNCTVENVTLGNTNSKAPVADGKVGRNYGKLIIDGAQYIADGVALNAEGEYEISNANGLKYALENIVKRVGGQTVSYTLNITEDITLDDSTAAWTYPTTSTDYVNITVKGNGKTITGLKQPLFEDISYGTINVSGLTFKDANVATHHTPATTIAAYMYGYSDTTNSKLIIDNCHVDGGSFTADRVGTASGTSAPCAAGFVGFVGGGYADITIKNSSVKNASFTGDDGTGALVGASYGKTTIDTVTVTGNTINGGNSAYSYSAAALVGSNISGATTVATNVTVNDNTYTYTSTNASYAINDSVYGYIFNGGSYSINGVQYISTPAALATALTANAETINIKLTADITVDINTLGTITGGSGQYKLGGENTTAINIDLNNQALTLSTTYWSALGAKNSNAVITVKNGSMNSSQATGTWNSYDLTFYDCTWNFEWVEFKKAVAIATDATVNMKNVTINESHDYYALWITMEGQTVTLDNVTINCPSGRAIAIKNEYVDAPVAVNLTVKNSKIISAKKAAILVTNNAPDTYTDEQKLVGATITLENVDISQVAADTTNAVWKDEKSPSINVTVNGGTCFTEPS